MTLDCGGHVHAVSGTYEAAPEAIGQASVSASIWRCWFSPPNVGLWSRGTVTPRPACSGPPFALIVVVMSYPGRIDA